MFRASSRYFRRTSRKGNHLFECLHFSTYCLLTMSLVKNSTRNHIPQTVCAWSYRRASNMFDLLPTFSDSLIVWSVNQIKSVSRATNLLEQMIKGKSELVTILQRARSPDWVSIGTDGQELALFFEDSIHPSLMAISFLNHFREFNDLLFQIPDILTHTVDQFKRLVWAVQFLNDHSQLVCLSPFLQLFFF